MMMKGTEIELSLDKIEEAAKGFLSLAGNNRQFAFYGEMGAGKTTFITALCQQLRAIDLVSSPTFSIVNEYGTESGDTIFHFDFYRIKDTEELFDIGFEEYLYEENWCFIEWPERAEALLPETFTKVTIEISKTGNRILHLQS